MDRFSMRKAKNNNVYHRSVLSGRLFLMLYNQNRQQAALVLGFLNGAELMKLLEALRSPQLKASKKGDQVLFVYNAWQAFMASKAGTLGQQRPVEISPPFSNIKMAISVFMVALLISALFILPNIGFGGDNSYQDYWLVALSFVFLMPFIIALGRQQRLFDWHSLPASSWLASGVASCLLVGLMAVNDYQSRIGSGSFSLVLDFSLLSTLYLTTAVIIGPFIEEVLFRGLLLNQIAGLMVSIAPNWACQEKQQRSKEEFHLQVLTMQSLIWALAIHALFFSLVHQHNNAFSWFIYAASGMILGWLRYISNSLWPSMLAHSLANLLLILL